MKNKVYLSTRRGSWVFNRVGINGWPADLILITELTRLAIKYVPQLVNWVAERELNLRFNHQTYGLKPEHRPFRKRFNMC